MSKMSISFAEYSLSYISLSWVTRLHRRRLLAAPKRRLTSSLKSLRTFSVFSRVSLRVVQPRIVCSNSEVIIRHMALYSYYIYRTVDLLHTKLNTADIVPNVSARQQYPLSSSRCGQIWNLCSNK